MRERTTTTRQFSRTAEIRALAAELPREYRGMRVDRHQLAELLLDGLLTYAQAWDCWVLAQGNQEVLCDLPA